MLSALIIFTSLTTSIQFIMNTKLKPIILLLIAFSIIPGVIHAQRFLSEIFPSHQVTQNVIYGNNISVLTGSPMAQDLTMDVYEPAGMPDPLQQRPLIILMHTGSFLPTYINQQPTGSRRDSTIVEMCSRFARRGYVTAAMSYRLGWNPAATGGGANEDIRRGTLLTAVYRSIQDAKACVRFMKKDAATANQFKIDSTNIVLGGIGSGGYTALAYATLNLPGEITLPKFLSNNNVGAPYNYVAGGPYVNPGIQGDYDGYGGNAALNNPNNSVGHSNNIQFVFNMGGAIGDSSWMAAGDAPMVALHVVGDPFAPFGYGPVIVPTTGDYVVDVSGSSDVVRLATQFGNNNCFNSAGFTDPFTVKANTLNNGYDGLYPFVTNPAVQAGPWEWFDSVATVQGAQAVGMTAQQGAQIYSNALLTNPDMSKTKALAYIDTVMGYLNPRIVYCLNLPTGIHENNLSGFGFEVFPNPASDAIQISSLSSTDRIRSVNLTDLNGKIVSESDNLNSAKAEIGIKGISKGVYLLKIVSSGDLAVRKIIIN